LSSAGGVSSWLGISPDRVDWLIRNVTEPVGKLFLRVIFSIVLPLVFSALVLGAVELGDLRRLRAVGGIALFFTGLLSLSSVLIGVGLVNWIQPGRSLTAQQRETLNQRYAGPADDALAAARQAKPLRVILLDLIPENPLQEMVGALDGSSKGNGMLAVMIFALIFGTGMAAVGSQALPLVQVFEALFAVSMRVVQWAMALAPIGVACLMFGAAARLGWGLFVPLAAFVLVVVLGLTLQMFVVYPVMLLVGGKRNPVAFFSRIGEVILVAFGTSSSNATLPTALRVAEADLGIPKNVARFVLTVGATANQNGTALYEGVVVLFLAQVFGVELSLLQQFLVILMAVLAGVGTAGIPGGSLPVIVIIMQSVGVPAEGIGIILGLDRFLDMCRTVVNVVGDLTIAECVRARTSEEAAVQTQDEAG
ncbi:MAG: dicarboxylate/amino acid:cation symporter, partial [Thermogutta sp.]|nr:dicarboxylate/amino acid:cation symporter [Thermogutta sp.]